MPPKAKSKNHGALGKQLIANHTKKKVSGGISKAHVTDFVQSENTVSGKLKSIIERSALDDYLVTGLAATGEEFTVVKQRELINLNVNRIVKGRNHNFNADKAGVSYDVDVPIPRRTVLFVGPNATKEKYNAEQLDEMEKNAFLNWRKEVARLEEERDFVLTPFERNLEFWRQLWRVVEKSDVVAQVIDGRNPLFYRCRDAERYVKEVDPEKKTVVIINKADFLSRAEREQWVRYFQEQGLDVLFFSAIREQFRLGQFIPAEGDNTATRENQIGFGSLEFEYQHGDMADVLDCQQLLHKLCETAGKPVPTIGMVGFPNVGKSSLINALCGEKKVSVSRQPGKTKHFQTLNMEECTLCDCPGLVFPSVVATRSHLIINGVMPIDHFKGDICEPAQLIVDRTTAILPHHFGVPASPLSYRVRPSPSNPVGILDARAYLAEVCEQRHYYAQGRGQVPDLFKITKILLKDYCAGNLLHNEPPPRVNMELSVPVDKFRKEHMANYLPGGFPMQPGDELPMPVGAEPIRKNNFGGVMKLPDAADVGANAPGYGSDFGSDLSFSRARRRMSDSEDSDSEDESSDESDYAPVMGTTRNVGGGDLFSNLMTRVRDLELEEKAAEERRQQIRRAQRIEDGLNPDSSSEEESD